MSIEKQKLLIKIGDYFEAAATGPLAILIVFAIVCILALAYTFT